MTRRSPLTVMLLALTLITGCGSSKHVGVPRLKTTPVTGTVHVDGEPAAGLTVECHPSGDSNSIKHPVSAMTDPEGKFSVGMYQAGDGLPEGTYNLTFTWEFGVNPKDKLKRAYVDPAKSQHKVTVVSGGKNDLGIIDLKTKK